MKSLKRAATMTNFASRANKSPSIVLIVSMRTPARFHVLKSCQSQVNARKYSGARDRLLAAAHVLSVSFALRRGEGKSRYYSCSCVSDALINVFGNFQVKAGQALELARGG